MTLRTAKRGNPPDGDAALVAALQRHIRHVGGSTDGRIPALHVSQMIAPPRDREPCQDEK